MAIGTVLHRRATPATILVSQLTKNLVHRPRPATDIENGLFGPLFSVDHGSFPSGHSVTAGFVIVGVAALFPAGKRLVWWIIAAVIGGGMIWQRTLINAHWLSDTVLGHRSRGRDHAHHLVGVLPSS